MVAVCLDLRDRLDHSDQRVRKDQQGRQVNRVLRVSLDLKVCKANKDLLDRRAK